VGRRARSSLPRRHTSRGRCEAPPSARAAPDRGAAADRRGAAAGDHRRGCLSAPAQAEAGWPGDGNPHRAGGSGLRARRHGAARRRDACDYYPDNYAHPVAERPGDGRSAGQGKDLSEHSDFEAAIAIYQNLAQRAPNDPRPQAGWAWVSILDYDFEQAEVHAQKAFDLDPNSLDAVLALARTLVEKGEKARALATAQQAVALGSNNSSAHAVLAEALRLNERYPEAVDEADRALVLDNNNADAHRARGWLYYLSSRTWARPTASSRSPQPADRAVDAASRVW